MPAPHQKEAPKFFVFISGGSVSSEDSVCERTQDEKTILLPPDPLQEFVNGGERQGLRGQRAEAEVELEASRHPSQQVFGFTAAVEGA